MKKFNCDTSTVCRVRISSDGIIRTDYFTWAGSTSNQTNTQNAITIDYNV